MKHDTSFRRAVANVAPAVRTLSDRDLKAFVTACLDEIARREGVVETTEWARLQADRLGALDGVTA